MTARRYLIGGLAMLSTAAAIVAGAGQPGGPGSQPRARGHGARAVGATGLRRLGPVDPAADLGFALALRLRTSALRRTLRELRTPGSSRFGHRLSAGEFGVRFGLSSRELGGLDWLLRRLGVRIRRTYTQRTAVLVEASAATISRVFSVQLGDYVDTSGRHHAAAGSEPRIPPELAPYVTGVGGLTALPPMALDVPASGLTPPVVANAYDITPLWNAGIQGQGQTIAVVSLATFNPADIQAYDQMAAIAGAPPIARVPVDGGTADAGQADPQGIASEVALDLEVVRGIAPQASILNYEVGGQQNLDPQLADAYNQIVQDGRASVVTTSYGVCEASTAVGAGDAQLIDNALAAAQARGITVFAASGDTGAYACLQVDGTNLSLGVQTPASSGGLISVGGTRLALRQDGTYLDEQAWSNPLTRQAGGGGIASAEARPAWQTGPGVLKPGVNPSGRRQVPDVAGPSDPNGGFLVCYAAGRQGGPACTPGSGGTSAAAPFWAAALLLVDQYAEQHGAGAPRFAAPILYSLASGSQPLPAFHDILHGNNGFYSATPGWDYATGLGTPDVYNLAQDYASYLRGAH
jgi:kumamolisin